ncbi:ICOS ligand [Pseudophryne corroboree]|uniref:ICOS ligand n=1 Tax=Pseudophryne corroboree TaxID=495146 RepID=UPI00308211C1
MGDSPKNRVAGMCFCSWLLTAALWSLLVEWGCSAGVTGRLGGSVDMSCKEDPLKHPIDEITMYWELQNQLVAIVWLGKVNTSLQNETYKGRAHLNPLGVRKGDFTLHLSNLSHQDIGTYLCAVFWIKETTQRLQKTEVDLNVTDDIDPISVQAVYGQEQNLTCMTPLVIRKPRIMWINSSDGTELQEGRIHNHVQQDGVTDYVASTLSINVTSNLSITCMIMTEHSNITAQTYKMYVTSGNPNEEKHGDLFVPIFVTLAVVIIILVAGTVIFRRKIFSPKHSEQRVRYQPAHESCQEVNG